MPESILKPLCTPENYVRNTFYSDVFRTDVILDDEVKTLDIERIQVPFSSAREKMLRDTYGLSKPDIDEYYHDLSRSIRNGITIPIKLHQNEEFEKNNSMSVVSYLHQEVIRTNDNDAFEIYLLTEPMSRYLDSPNCPNGRISLGTFVSKLSARLTKTLNDLHNLGIYIGVVEPDSICCYGDSAFIALTSFIFARSNDDKVQFAYPKIMSPYAHPSLAQGALPDEHTDLYSLGAFLISVLNGTYGTTRPSLSLEGDYPPELVNALRTTLQNDATIKDFIAGMKIIKKSTTLREQANSMLIPLNLGQPDYLTDVNEKPDSSTRGYDTDAGSDDDDDDDLDFDLDDFNFDLEPDEELLEVSFDEDNEPDTKKKKSRLSKSKDKGHTPKHARN